METQNHLVVGGSSGIGLEIVKILHSRNYAVFAGSRSSDTLTGMDGLHYLALDVEADTLNFEGLPEYLNGLVYCPGTIRLKPFHRLSIDDFEKDLQVNFLGAVKTIQACLPLLKKSPAGASIVMFSTVAVKTGMPFHASVAGAKAAIEGLTRSLAAEFAPRIRVNTIAPSLTDTPLAQGLLSSEDKRKASAERHPARRIGTPQEVAQIAVQLLSPSNAWMTGQIIHVDGGMSALRTFR